MPNQGVQATRYRARLSFVVGRFFLGKIIHPNECDIYAGISGVAFSCSDFQFGHGVSFKKTSGHIMAPYLAAFAPAEPGKPHPAPWKPVGGGMAFDVQAELFIPLAFQRSDWFDRMNSAWWIVALLRLKASPLVTVPVLADRPFSQIPLDNDEPMLWSIEMRPSRLIPVETPATNVDESDLIWVRSCWITGGTLMNTNDGFNMAMQAIDNCIWSNSPSLALVSLWGALERLFSPSPYELSFRVSAAIASFLEPPGKERLECFRRVKKLYDARSKAAHGSPSGEIASLHETYALVRRTLIKILENNHLPSRSELEALIFGANLSSSKDEIEE